MKLPCSLAAGLGRQGSNVVFDQALIRNEAWLPRHGIASTGASLSGCRFPREIDVRFDQYRKFKPMLCSSPAQQSTRLLFRPER